jgi:prepilin-type N-terminal cleavage/methylation domain-containing protein
MSGLALQLDVGRRRLARAFTLVEVLIVVTLLAILATLVAPGLANATAPLPQTVVSTLEIDMRRASIEAIGRLTPVALVVSADRNGWWVAERANLGTPIPGTTRILGNGSLGPFAGYVVDVTVDGVEPAPGDAILCEFNTVGARSGTVLMLQLRPSAAGSLDAAGNDAMGLDVSTAWRLESERTRFELDEG